MTVLRICNTGLSVDTAHAFHSMLGIVSGRASASWEASDIDHADVLLAHADSDPAALLRWNTSGKPMVLVIDDRGSWPPTPFVLRHPFRVMQLLSILDDVAASILRKTPVTREGHTGWAVAESLRRITGNAGDRGWHVAQAGRGVSVWLGDQQAYAAPEVLGLIRAGKLLLEPFEATSQRPPADTVPFAASDVAWCAGMQSPAELAPWLTPDMAYRLRRWPDFGRLDAQPGMIELSALLAAQAHTPYELARCSGHDQHRVHRFLVATSLAGQLQVASAAKATAGSARPRLWTRFVADLCRHLRGVA